MSGQGYKNRKQFVKDVKKSLGKGVTKRRTWPELKEGECVYLVKNRTTGEKKEVIATERFYAEAIAFPVGTAGAFDEIRSMPLHCYKSKKENNE